MGRPLAPPASPAAVQGSSTPPVLTRAPCLPSGAPSTCDSGAAVPPGVYTRRAGQVIARCAPRSSVRGARPWATGIRGTGTTGRLPLELGSVGVPAVAAFVRRDRAGTGPVSVSVSPGIRARVSRGSPEPMCNSSLGARTTGVMVAGSNQPLDQKSPGSSPGGATARR